MRTLFLAAALTLPAVLAGCGGTNYGVFATSTTLGIDADAKAGKIALGYDRTEGFIGPSYPKNGTAPSVFGFIESDQAVFTPAVKQLYATGTAADLVTEDEPPKKPTHELSEGTPKTMAFGTTTSIALSLKFSAAAPLPDSITLGYKRSEASVIPVQPGDASTPARYVSTLAAIEMNSTAKEGFNGTELGVRQFFATGHAANNLAADKTIRGIFRAEAEKALSAGERDSAVARAARITVASCIQKGSGNFDAQARYRLEKLLAMSSLSAAQKKAILEDATDPASLSDAINNIVPGSTKQLQRFVTEKAAQLCEA